MFSIYLLDSSKLFQWDLNRKIKIIGKEEVDEVHFSHIGDEEALVVKPIKENNILIANIPNILLQESKDIFVYLVSKDKTLKETFFTVGRREKPTDYLYTEIDILNYSSLEKRLAELEEKLKNIPVEETDPTVPDWAKQPNKPRYTAAEVGALSSTETVRQLAQKQDKSNLVTSINESSVDSTYPSTRAVYEYVGKEFARLIGSAPDALNTIEELANAFNNNQDVLDALNASITSKQDKTDSVGIKTTQGGEIFNNYNNNIASALYAHAEGESTESSGIASHSEGTGTVANANAQHVQGKYNVEDTENKYAHIVGGGSSNTDRKNIHTLDWEGNAEYQGDIVARGCGGENPISLVETANDLNNKITAPLIAFIGQILEVEEVDENGKPTKWKTVDKPEVVTTTTDDKGKIVTVNSEGNKILEYPSMISYKYADKIQESNTGVLFCFDTAKPNLGLFSMPNKITTFRVYKDGVYIQGADLKTYSPFIELNVIDCNETRIFVIGKLVGGKVISYFYYFRSNEWSVETQMLPLESLENMFIQRPDEAEVGQILVVKAVDENGKPIEWEVIDAPTGSGGDGYSPIATVEQTETGATISIQDKNGTTTAVVNHGADGKDGKDGYTPQKGIDYFDGKDGLNGQNGADGKSAYEYAKDGGYTGTEEEFAQKMAEEIGGVEITDGEPTKESTVMTLNPNAEKVNLYTAPEIDELLRNLPSGSDLDVQINGESIVENGVANIPYANYQNFGVVRANTSTNRPVYIDSTGMLQAGIVESSDLTNRNHLKLISGNTYDEAVKLAMCDGKGAEWTEEEKASARERMGAVSSEELGGHWETVMDIVWDFNDYITVVSYDAENHIFTCNQGELDWATVGEKMTYAVFPVCDNNACKTKEMPFNKFRELSGTTTGNFLGAFVKLTDTTFTFKDTEDNIIPVPNEATMDISKFHFEHLEKRTIDNLKCKKARYTLTNMIVPVSIYSTPPEFLQEQYSGNMGIEHSWAYKSCTQTEITIIGGFALETSSTTQLSTSTGTYASSSIINYFKQTSKPVEEINSLFFSIDWNNGVNLPRNGGLFKLERWVE